MSSYDYTIFHSPHLCAVLSAWIS